MNLSKLFQMQKELDDYIVKTKGLEGQDLLPQKILALQTELGECANSWRGFKYWSENQQPKQDLLEEYADCIHFFLSIAIYKGWEESMYLSEDAIEETKESGLDGGVTGALLECMYWIMKMHMENKPNEKIESLFSISTKEFYFRQAWYVFIVTGIVGFGFTLEEMESAYTTKWEINKQRQNSGY